jgi:pimeloyl-ACP methyl ester carboxylesterase
MDQFTVRRVVVEQGEVEVREIGQGRPVLLLHGALSDWTFWDAVRGHLSGHPYRLIMPTLPLGSHRLPVRPGADLTPPGLAALIADVIRGLGHGPVAVVANDTSTALTQILLTRHPKLVERAVLTSGDAYDHFFPPIFRPFKAFPYLPGGLWLLAAAMRRPALARPIFGLLTRTGLTQEQAHAWSEPLLRDRRIRRDFNAAVRGVSRRHTQAAAALLPAVDVPVLLAWSEGDRAFPRHLAERLHAALPHSRLEIVPGSSAFSPLDNPAHLANLIVGFLEESAPAGPASVQPPPTAR